MELQKSEEFKGFRWVLKITLMGSDLVQIVSHVSWGSCLVQCSKMASACFPMARQVVILKPFMDSQPSQFVQIFTKQPFSPFVPEGCSNLQGFNHASSRDTTKGTIATLLLQALLQCTKTLPLFYILPQDLQQI